MSQKWPKVHPKCTKGDLFLSQNFKNAFRCIPVKCFQAYSIGNACGQIFQCSMLWNVFPVSVMQFSGNQIHFRYFLVEFVALRCSLKVKRLTCRADLHGLKMSRLAPIMRSELSGSLAMFPEHSSMLIRFDISKCITANHSGFRCALLRYLWLFVSP